MKKREKMTNCIKYEDWIIEIQDDAENSRGFYITGLGQTPIGNCFQVNVHGGIYIWGSEVLNNWKYDIYVMVY